MCPVFYRRLSCLHDEAVCVKIHAANSTINCLGEPCLQTRSSSTTCIAPGAHGRCDANRLPMRLPWAFDARAIIDFLWSHGCRAQRTCRWCRIRRPEDGESASDGPRSPCCVTTSVAKWQLFCGESVKSVSTVVTSNARMKPPSTFTAPCAAKLWSTQRKILTGDRGCDAGAAIAMRLDQAFSYADDRKCGCAAIWLTQMWPFSRSDTRKNLSVDGGASSHPSRRSWPVSRANGATGPASDQAD